jgi:uncharacterized protein (TIGR03437 family)
MWDSSVDLWVVSRKDLGTVGGAYAALSDNRFLVDNNLLDESLYPVAKLQTGTGSSSGAGFAAGAGLRTTTTSAAGPGTLERIDLVNLQSFHATPTIEAPEMAATLNTVPIGQIGQTILPFTRTLAVPADQRSILLLTQSGITVLSPDFDAPTTAPAVSSVASLADGTSGVAPGGLIAISGTGLAPGSAVANALPLPTSLGEACATVNNVALPLFWVSPTQFAAQLPFSVTGAALLIVRDPGGLSAPYSLHIQDSAPSIFRSGAAGDETGLATVVRFENNELVTFTNPIHTNEWIIIYLTGLGLTSPAAPLGDAAPWNPLALAVSPPTVTIGGTPLALAFAGLTPGSVGVYQINAYVPGAVRGASQTPLVITQGQASTTLQVRVVNP